MNLAGSSSSPGAADPLRETPAPCPVCGGAESEIFAHFRELPLLAHRPCRSREEALAVPRRPVSLAFCSQCSHVFDPVFDVPQDIYQGGYENSLQFSSVFRSYLAEEAKGLVERYGIYGRKILEIGCGDGDFLRLLCRLGNNRGVGFDPILEAPRKKEERLELVGETYPPEGAEGPFALVCCRQTLEHLADPLSFLRALRVQCGPQSLLFFEVPNGLMVIEKLRIWEVISEHRSYFTPASLTHLFRAAGFRVLRLRETFEGQYLCVEAMAGEGGPGGGGLFEGGGEMGKWIPSFADRCAEKVRSWKWYLGELFRSGRRGVIWGAGSKTVTFLNLLELCSRPDFVVDINPRKRGCYVAGTGQLIAEPAFLQRHRPDFLLILNSVYREEIVALVGELGLSPALICV